jgi:glycosyltransferase involved in cell wall biosynthesis
MKIALIHEFLNQLGGAERVLQNFLEIWPNAKLHTLIYDEQKTHGIFSAYAKKLSFINDLPLARGHHRWLLPLMPFGIENFKFDEFDVVISDSSSFAKGVNSKDRLHICYCHTPTRFLWTEFDSYLDAQKIPYIIKVLAKPVLRLIKKWDYRAGQKPHFFIANSVNVQNRIKKYYNRDSIVIPPPVDTQVFHPEGNKENYFFVASRLEPYKKIELVIQAFNELGLPLKVAGSGTTSGKLRSMARSNIEFLGRITDEELRRRYSEARAFIFPAEEDAGIMVLEAQACGTPVIAYKAGGVLETVKEGVTGQFFTHQSVEAVKQAIKNFDSSKYDRVKIRENALKYDKQVFQQKIRDFVKEKYENWTRS